MFSLLELLIKALKDYVNLFIPEFIGTLAFREDIFELQSVLKDGFNLCKIDQYLQTYELCSTAVKSFGMNLHDIPLQNRTYEMC
jgi:hypothetical protein